MITTISLAPATAQAADLLAVTAAIEKFDPEMGCMVREDYTFAVQRQGGYTRNIQTWVDGNCTIQGIAPTLIELYSDEWKTAADDRLARCPDPLADEF